jgi:hypothetical protein
MGELKQVNNSRKYLQIIDVATRLAVLQETAKDTEKRHKRVSLTPALA